MKIKNVILEYFPPTKEEKIFENDIVFSLPANNGQLIWTKPLKSNIIHKYNTLMIYKCIELDWAYLSK